MKQIAKKRMIGALKFYIKLLKNKKIIIPVLVIMWAITLAFVICESRLENLAICLTVFNTMNFLYIT